MRTRYAIAIATLSLAFSAFAFYTTWRVQAENHKLSHVNAMCEQRIKLSDEQARIQQSWIDDLTNTLAEERRKPTYDAGYRDAMIRVNNPLNTGTFFDGWDAALKTIDVNNYTEGYHAAMQQMGYIIPQNARTLVPVQSSEEKTQTGTPVKLEKK